MKHLHFISGLPRAGTTLLASILRQNPAVHASIMSPVGQVVTDAVTAMGEHNEARSFITDVDRDAIAQAIFRAYYAGSRPHVFDNNRRWLGNMDLLARLWPDARVIAMVRPVAEIVDSFERVFRAGAIKPSVIYGGYSNTTVYDRYDTMMQNGGVIKYAYDALKDAWYGPHKNRCLFIEYGQLASKPQETLDAIPDCVTYRHGNMSLTKFSLFRALLSLTSNFRRRGCMRSCRLSTSMHTRSFCRLIL